MKYSKESKPITIFFYKTWPYYTISLVVKIVFPKTVKTKNIGVTEINDSHISIPFQKLIGKPISDSMIRSNQFTVWKAIKCKAEILKLNSIAYNYSNDQIKSFFIE